MEVNNQIKIRRAVEADCPRLLELVNELAVYERAPGEVTVSLREFEESGFGNNPVWWGFVACAHQGAGSEKPELLPAEQPEGKVIGFALYYIRYSTWKGRRLYLEDILVTEDMRGRGVGKLLFDRIIEEAKEKKFNGIVWQVLEWNEPAINFYKKYNAKFDPEWVNGSIEF